MTNSENCIIGVLTVSDRASSGDYEDISGPAIVSFLEESIISEWETICRIVPDESDTIEEAIADLSDNYGCSLIVTTGGTGPAKRDVTPEATIAACDKIIPGFGEQMRAISLRHVPTAVLSRQTAGVRGTTLVLNLPGSPRSISETLVEIFPAIPYCVDLIGGPYIETDSSVVDSYRPPHAIRE